MFALLLPLVAKLGLGALTSWRTVTLKKLELANEESARQLKENLASIDAEIGRLGLIKDLQIRENEYWSFRVGKVGFIWASLFWYGALVYNQVFKDIQDLQWKVYTVPALEYVLYSVVGYLFLKTSINAWKRK